MNTQEQISAEEALASPKIDHQPIWPDYFARIGQPDASNWHYQGYWKDTWTCWKAYYSLMIFHPIVSFYGLRHFCQSLVYRISTEQIGDILRPFSRFSPRSCRSSEASPATWRWPMRCRHCA